MNFLLEISLEIFLFRNTRASLARAAFPLKLSLIPAIDPRYEIRLYKSYCEVKWKVKSEKWKSESIFGPLIFFNSRYDARQNFGTVFGVHFPLKKVPQKGTKNDTFLIQKGTFVWPFFGHKMVPFFVKMKPHKIIAERKSVVFSSTYVAKKRNYHQILRICTASFC